ncbi:hypothetical protein IQ267_15160 [filamentous cyanobacterium LEGE 07170]|nr:hypothetical protein [filamentous cyanobacterium LEGE 07170]
MANDQPDSSECARSPKGLSPIAAFSERLLLGDFAAECGDSPPQCIADSTRRSRRLFTLLRWPEPYPFSI